MKLQHQTAVADAANQRLEETAVALQVARVELEESQTQCAGLRGQTQEYESKMELMEALREFKASAQEELERLKQGTRTRDWRKS